MDLIVRLIQPNPEMGGINDTIVERFQDCLGYSYEGDEGVLKVMHSNGITKYPLDKVVRSMEVRTARDEDVDRQQLTEWSQQIRDAQGTSNRNKAYVGSEIQFKLRELAERRPDLAAEISALRRQVMIECMGISEAQAKRVTALDHALASETFRVAKDFCKDADKEGEYVRACAEMVCDLTGLPMDYRGQIIEALTK